MKKTLKNYILNNQEQGFDELAFNAYALGYTKKPDKDLIKQTWNKLGLGFKSIPRTRVTVATIREQGKTMYELQNDIVFFITSFLPIYVPAGMKTDFGSVPKVFHWIIDKDDPNFLIAWLVHDLMYFTKLIDSRIIADNFMSYIARISGAPEWKIFLVYWGVRIGGHTSWNFGKTDNHLKEKITELSFKYLAEQKEKLVKISNKI